MLHIVVASTIEHADRLTRNMFEARKTRLRHAPPPLAARGLDMNDGHPAAMIVGAGIQARFSRLGPDHQDRH